MNYLVTGVSRGIGLELASQLLTQGHFVVATARNPEKSHDLMILAKEYKANCQILRLDTSSLESVKACAKEISVPHLDVLINNAGILRDYEANIEHVDLTEIENSFRTNVLGPIQVTKHLLPLLKKGKNPKVVNVTSLMGSIADNSSGRAYGYRISKAALNMFSKNLSIDEKWLTVLMVHPGWVKTDMGGSNALIPAPEAASEILKLAVQATNHDSGKFFNYAGETLPW